MSEIKIGDHMICYGGDMPDVIRYGHVSCISKDGQLLILNPDYKKTWGYSFQAHRKQCRKLVKKVKCNSCCGDGYRGTLIGGYFECTECNGIGVMKVNS